MPNPTVHVLYENPAWLPPLVAGLKAEGFPVRLVEVVEGALDPAEVPDEGIWLNRISPSSHTRDHGRTVDLTREILFWLEAHGRGALSRPGRRSEIEGSPGGVTGGPWASHAFRVPVEASPAAISRIRRRDGERPMPSQACDPLGCEEKKCPSTRATPPARRFRTSA